MSFTITGQTIKIFKKILDVCKDIGISDIRLICSSEKISINGMSSCHVSLLLITIFPEKSDINESFILDISVIVLHTVLKKFKDTDIKFTRLDDTLDIFQISKEIGELKINISLLSIEQDTMEIPPIEYNDINFSSNSFSSISDAINILDDGECKISLYDNKIVFNANGDVNGSKTSINITKEFEDDDKNDDKNDELIVCHTYSCKYINSFSKFSSLFSEVSLNLANEFPFLILFENDNIKINCYIAPKMNNEQ